VQLVSLLRRLSLSVPACRTLVWTGRPVPRAAKSVLQVLQAYTLRRRIFLLRAPDHPWSLVHVTPRVTGTGDPLVTGTGDPLVTGTGDHPWSLVQVTPRVTGTGAPLVTGTGDPLVTGTGDHPWSLVQVTPRVTGTGDPPGHWYR